MPEFKNIPGRIEWRHTDFGLPMAHLSSPGGEAKLCLQGAQLVDYRPTGQQPVLWLSERAALTQGKAIRGGIPICWPWFGDHPDNPEMPAHGFARTLLWQLQDCGCDDSTTWLRLILSDNEATRCLWPFTFRLELLIELDSSLRLTLTTHNRSSNPMPISEALHSYFQVGDITAVALGGLDNCCYHDKLQNNRLLNQTGALTLQAATDRVYLDSPEEQWIDDAQLSRRIRIRKLGAHDRQPRSTVVWNPWAEKCAAMPDMTPEGYRTMICVESANALDNSVVLPPDSSHQLAVELSSTPLATTKPA